MKGELFLGLCVEWVYFSELALYLGLTFINIIWKSKGTHPTKCQ